MNSCSNHLSFHCSSGEVLWGQLHCICEGYFNGQLNRYDTPQSIPELESEGTIKQRYFHYRCRAVKGDWQAKPYQTRWDLTSEPFKSGYIIYNIGYNPADILKRCAAVGCSLYQTQTHNDRSIVYVNRYDWSCHHDYEFESKINRLLKINLSISREDDSFERLFHGRIIIVDSNSAMNIIQQWKSNRTELLQSQENIFLNTDNQSNMNPVGLHLSHPNTEYELAWLVFNGDQSDSELIAIVYDGSYTSLDGQIIFDGEDIVSWNEYQSKEEELKRRNEELMKKWQLAAEN